MVREGDRRLQPGLEVLGHPQNRPIVPRWAWLFLTGPITWYLYFWVGYVAEEAGCPVNNAALVTWVAIGLIGALMVAIAYYAQPKSLLRNPRDSGPDDHGSLVGVGLLLGVFFVVVTLFIGVPDLVLQPC